MYAFSPKRWTIERQDAVDASGDGVLQLPDELWNELVAQGWEVGDVLEIDLITVPGTVTIRDLYAQCRQISAPAKS